MGGKGGGKTIDRMLSKAGKGIKSAKKHGTKFVKSKAESGKALYSGAKSFGRMHVDAAKFVGRKAAETFPNAIGKPAKAVGDAIDKVRDKVNETAHKVKDTIIDKPIAAIKESKAYIATSDAINAVDDKLEKWGIYDIGKSAFNYIRNTSKLLKALTIIAAVAVIALLIYVLFYFAQPRITFFCHSDNRFFENMDALFTRAQDLVEKHAGAIGSPLSSTKDDWMFYYMFAELIDYKNNHDKLGMPDLNYTDLWGNEQSTSPISHTNAWSGFVKWDENYIGNMAPQSIRDIINGPPDPSGASPSGGIGLDAYIQTRIPQMSKFRNDLAKYVQSSKTVNVDILELNVILNVYSDQLIYDYDFRRPPGYVLQFTLMKVYLSEFAHYCFVDQIKNTVWRKWFANFVPWFTNGVNNFITTVTRGIDAVVQSFINGQMSQVEGLGGVIGLFMIIPQAIQLIFKFFQQVGRMANNPIGFIEWVVLALLAILLKIVWVILASILYYIVDPLAIVLAFLLCTALTTLWTAAFLVVFLVLLVVVLLDMLTFGSVCMVLRCENMPDAWKVQRGFQNGNGYSQNITCSLPCPQGYKPNGFYFCVPTPAGEPPFCPQQYIYSSCSQKNNAYVKPQDKEPTSPTAPNRMPLLLPYEFIYPASSKYYTANAADKKKMLDDFYPYIEKYFQSCHGEFKPYDPIALTMCNSLDSYGLTDSIKNDLKKLCYQLYCDFADSDPALPGIQPTFCGNARPKDIPPADESAAELQGTDRIQTKIAVATVTATFVVIVAASLYYKYTRRTWTTLP